MYVQTIYVVCILLCACVCDMNCDNFVCSSIMALLGLAVLYKYFDISSWQEIGDTSAL